MGSRSGNASAPPAPPPLELFREREIRAIPLPRQSDQEIPESGQPHHKQLEILRDTQQPPANHLQWIAVARIRRRPRSGSRLFSLEHGAFCMAVATEKCRFVCVFGSSEVVVFAAL